jgi:hypothetical protein
MRIAAEYSKLQYGVLLCSYFLCSAGVLVVCDTILPAYRLVTVVCRCHTLCHSNYFFALQQSAYYHRSPLCVLAQ